MIRVVPFEPRHLDLIEFREIDLRAFREVPDLRAMILDLAAKGVLWTVLAPEGVVCLGGLVILWKGVAEAWLAASELVKKYPVAFTRLVKSRLDSFFTELGLHRIQVNVLKEHARSHQWVMRALRFTEEGMMKKYGPGAEDYIRYARVRP